MPNKIVMTGGHHTSALPIIEYLQANSPDVEIHWFGHKNTLKGDIRETLEFKEISALKVPFYDLKAGKLYKNYNIASLLKIPLGIIHAFRLLFKIKPDLIVSFGGYLAAPTVLAGKLLGIPSVTHEQTVVAGYANKFISHFVDKIFLSWPQSSVYYPSNKTIVSGIPLRKEIFEVSSSKYTVENNLPFIYITAGKTGSHSINSVVKESLPELLTRYNVIHQCGDTELHKDFEHISSYYTTELKDKVAGIYFPEKFVYSSEIGEAYSKASLVVSRSGAHTISELIALKKPAVLIPIAWVSHNEQLENALLVKKAGLGEVLEEVNLNKSNLINYIDGMFNTLPSYKLLQEDLTNHLNMDSTRIISETILSY